MKILLTFALLLFSLPALCQQIGVDATKKYLINTTTNKPVFCTGDNPFDISLQITTADATRYLDDRAARGFNCLWVAITDAVEQTGAPNDQAGNAPFTGGNFTTPNATYWAHQDAILKLISARGMIAFVNVAFVGLNNASGWRAQMMAASDATMTAYGTFLGNRYKNFPLLVWVMGGDADPNNATIYTRINDIATGIVATGDTHLITLEAARFLERGGNAPNNGYSSVDATTVAYGSPPSWLKVNWTYRPLATAQAGCNTDYRQGMPNLTGEDWYELEHSMTALQLRNEAYWEILSGCTVGRLFGNQALYAFTGPENTSGLSWQSQLGSNGSLHQALLGSLVRSREFWKMVPDTSHTYLTSGFGSGTTLSVCSRTSDGQTIMCYVPNGSAATIVVNMTGITDSGNLAKANWFSPTTGAVTAIAGTIATSGTHSFTPPNTNDWVLVIDSASANLAAPGSTGNRCDINKDGVVNVLDVQLSVNQALKTAPCTADINLDGQCNVVDVQRVVNAALAGLCVSP